MKTLILALLLLPLSAWAKAHPDADYQPGILLRTQRIASGESCRGNADTTASANSYGSTANVTATTYANSGCSPDYEWDYTVQVGENTFVVTPGHSGKQTAVVLATMGWGAAFMKSSTLANQLPGTDLLVRSENGTLYVRVGKRESPFHVVDAR